MDAKNAVPDFLKNEYPFQPKSIEINGLKYSYVDEGQGQPIVMVHGNPTWSFYYRNLIKHFSKNYRVIAVDHIGCGFSDKPQDYDYTLANHVSNLTHLIEHLDLKNLNMVVHDWGGAIGFGYATKHPENVNRIMVMNTAAFLNQDIPRRISFCRLPVLGKFAVRAFNAFAGPATFMTTENPLPAHIKKGFLLPYDNWHNRIATHEFVRDIPLESDHRSRSTLQEIEENLGKISGKNILLCWGTKDWCFHTGFLKRWQHFFPDAETYTFDAGHYLIEDRPEEVIAKMEDFYKK